MQTLQKQGMSPLQANMTLRGQLASTGLYQDLPSPAQGLSLNLGGQTQIALNNLGYLTKLTCRVVLTYTPSAAPTLSPYGLYNFFPNIQLRDFSGLTRINGPLSAIVMRNASRKMRKDYAVKPQQPSLNSYSAETFGGNVRFYDGTNSFNSLPLANLNSGVSNVAVLEFEIPVCRDVDNADFTGMIDTQSTDGQIILNVTTLSASQLGAAGDDTKCFNGSATFSNVSAQIWVQQHFIMPQPDPQLQGKLPIPTYDIQQVYALESQNWNTNLAGNSETRISIANARQVDLICGRWFNNGYQGGNGYGNDIARHRLLLNAATSIFDRDQILQYSVQREEMGIELGMGSYLYSFIKNKGSGRGPIMTAATGNLQLGLTPSTVAGTNTFFEYSMWCTYPLGSTLSSTIIN